MRSLEALEDGAQLQVVSGCFPNGHLTLSTSPHPSPLLMQHDAMRGQGNVCESGLTGGPQVVPGSLGSCEDSIVPLKVIRDASVSQSSHSREASREELLEDFSFLERTT